MATSVDICNYALARLGDISITALDNSTKASRLCTLLYAQLRDEVLSVFPWTFATRRFYGAASLSSYVNVSAITVSTHAVTGIGTITVTTATAHGLAVSQSVRFTDIGGMTELNDNEYRVATVPGTTSFTLEGVDGADFATFTSGGNVRRAPLFSFEYSYTLPSDFLKDIKQQNEFDYEIHEGVLFTSSDEFELVYIGQETDTTKFPAGFIRILAARIAAELAWPITQSPQVQANMLTVYEKELSEMRMKDRFRGRRDERKDSRWITVRK